MSPGGGAVGLQSGTESARPPAEQVSLTAHRSLACSCLLLSPRVIQTTAVFFTGSSMEAIISTEAGGGGGHQGEVGVDQDEGAARPQAAALPRLPPATLETTHFC